GSRVQSGRSRPGRSDVECRPRIRSAHQAGDERTPRGTDQHHDRAPPLNGAHGRSDPRAASRPRPRGGHPRGAPAPRRSLRAALRATDRRGAGVTFKTSVLRLVARIPRGRVATYGQVAVLVGRPRSARAVGQVMRDADGVPWHRVVNSLGGISRRPRVSGMATEGARVVVVDVNEASAKATVEQIEKAGGQALALRADVTRAADNRMVVEKAQALWGQLDIFFANAGVPQSPQDVEDVDEALF